MNYGNLKTSVSLRSLNLKNLHKWQSNQKSSKIRDNRVSERTERIRRPMLDVETKPVLEQRLFSMERT